MKQLEGVHVVWTLASGGTLEDRPRYSKSRCFDPFPFPDTLESQKAKIRSLTQELDGLRKTVLADNADLTLTGIYNVLDKLKAGDALNSKEIETNVRGRVTILKDLHEKIDALVFDAYGWSPELTDEQIVEQLVILNVERSKEERRGFVRWLRPDYQADRFAPLAHRADRVQSIANFGRLRSKQHFPPLPKEQAARVLHVLRTSRAPLTATEIASSFAEGERVRDDVEDILKSLTRLGDVNSYDNGRTYFGLSA
jgi:hypothetical protein